MNQSIHYVDLLLWMLGDPQEVFGYAEQKAHPMIEVEDCASAVGKFASGAQGVIQGTTCTYQGRPARLQVHGTQGNVVIVGDQLRFWEVAGEETEDYPDAGLLAGAADPKLGMVGEAVPAHAEQIGDLLAAIEEGRQPVLSGQEARKAVELVLAIYRSQETGESVRLPLA
jgi:predicted dehydrogenase